jgi:selenide,water dikinase
VTGFSLLGHSWEMAAQSFTDIRFDYAALPWLPNVRHYAEAGCVPGGTKRNERSLRDHVRFASALGPLDQALLFDPQTSGGLLAAVDPALWATLVQVQDVRFWRIGEVTEQFGDQPVLTVA